MATKFQRRHYEAIAETIRVFHPTKFVGASEKTARDICNVVAELTTRLADMFQQDSKHFNREKFIRRCGWH